MRMSRRSSRSLKKSSRYGTPEDDDDDEPLVQPETPKVTKAFKVNAMEQVLSCIM